MKVLRSSNFIRRTDRGVLSAIARTRSASVATAFGSLAGKSALVLLVLWLRRRNRAIGKAAPLFFDLVRFILETDKHIQRFTAFFCLAKLSVDSSVGYVDRKSTRLNSSHPSISYAVFCLKKKKTQQ